MAYDLAHTKNKGDDRAAYAAYLSYKASKKLTLALREELGTHVNGTTGDLLGSTLTADYALWANVITRLEYRWDHAIDGGKAALGGTSRNAQLLALNVIYKF